jgi:hypothetical protein
VVQEFWNLIGPIAESDAISTIDDVSAAMSEELVGRLDTLDEVFWESAEELAQLVPMAYGPAPSVTETDTPEQPDQP